LLNVVTLGFFAIAIFGVSVLWQNGLLTKHFAGLTVLFLTVLLVALRWRRKQFSSQAILSISLFLVLPLCLAIMSPFTLPDQTKQVARALRSLNPEKKPVLVIGTNKLASRLRISSGGDYVVYQSRLRLSKGGEYVVSTGHASRWKEKNSTSASQSILVLTEGEARHLPANSFQLREIASYPIRVSLPKLFRATLKGDAKAYIESRKIHCYAVLPGSTTPIRGSLKN
jgi:uncharacterized SAM-binding protein YcdF (DUF218 family)